MAGNKKTHFELMRAKLLRERRHKLQLSKYEPKEKSIRGRVAEFLNMCAETYPHCTITYEEITQAIFTLGKIPDARAKHVKSVRGQMSSAGKLLLEKYNRTLITCTGVGARASVDNTDKVKESMTKAAENHRRTAEKLVRIADSIDPDQLDVELKELGGDPQVKRDLLEVAAWHKDLLMKYVRSLKKPQATAALLPPPPTAS